MERSDKSDINVIDAECRDKWNWKWVEMKVDDTLASECIRKLRQPGKAFCVWCSSEITYSKGGSSMIQ